MVARTPRARLERRCARRRARSARWATAIAIGASAAFLACDPTVTVGDWECAPGGTPDAAPSSTAPVSLPWSTGFEDRFCAYTTAGGFCYGDPAIHRIVTSPVHSGHHAAAFTVVAGDATAFQTRCVRQGTLPEKAIYGAWYFVPTLARNSGVWNLIHFQGGDVAAQHGLWDVSLVNGADGSLELVVYDFLNAVARTPTPPATVPIGAWFHVELSLARAADPTGAVALSLDGRVVLQETNLVTDDSSYGQFYVGNYATGLTPSTSTLYVDDVTIRAAP